MTTSAPSIESASPRGTQDVVSKHRRPVLLMVGDYRQYRGSPCCDELMERYEVFMTYHPYSESIKAIIAAQRFIDVAVIGEFDGSYVHIVPFIELQPRPHIVAHSESAAMCEFMLEHGCTHATGARRLSELVDELFK